MRLEITQILHCGTRSDMSDRLMFLNLLSQSWSADYFLFFARLSSCHLG